MFSAFNPYDAGECSVLPAKSLVRRDVSVLWFMASVAVFLTASNAVFASNGIWFTLQKRPLEGLLEIAILAGLCTLVYAPVSYLLRRKVHYRYTVVIALVSGMMFAIGDRLMRLFQSETGINLLLINVSICLACSVPIELALGWITRATDQTAIATTFKNT